MASAENREMVRRFDEELLGQGKLEVADEILAPDFVFFGPAAGVRGPEAFKGFVTMLRDAFSGLQFELQTVVADAAKAGRFAIMRGVHTGEFAGIAPSRRTVAAPRMDGFLFEGDRIKEVQAFLDHATLFTSLREATAD